MKKLLNNMLRRKNVRSIEEMDLYPEFIIPREQPFRPWEDRLVLRGLRLSTLLKAKEERRKSMPRRYKNAEKRIHHRFDPIDRRFAAGSASFGIVLLVLLEVLWLYMKV